MAGPSEHVSKPRMDMGARVPAKAASCCGLGKRSRTNCRLSNDPMRLATAAAPAVLTAGVPAGVG